MTSSTIRAARSPLTADLVTGPLRAARVLGVHPVALYLEVGGRILPVVTRDGLALPTAVVLPVTSGAIHWGVTVGDLVGVGQGSVLLPACRVETVREWTPARVPAGPSTSAHRPGDPLDVAGRAARLVGAGPGLTPSGDDVLCGLLLAGRAVGAGWLPELAGHVAELAPTRTTGLSASLLAAAVEGYAVAQVATFARLAARGERGTAYDLALARLLDVGHTSGAALAVGVLAVVDTVAAQHLARRRPIGLALDRPDGWLPGAPTISTGALSA